VKKLDMDLSENFSLQIYESGTSLAH